MCLQQATGGKALFQGRDILDMSEEELTQYQRKSDHFPESLCFAESNVLLLDKSDGTDADSQDWSG